MQKINFKAFTLVELIVVITVVGILSTVGFVSYSGYLNGVRDSNRISQLTKLSDSLQVYSASKTLPLPDNKIDITVSGTLIAYQGEVGVDVLETIDYTNGGKDPKDESYYTYYLTKDRKSLQLVAMMEEQSSTALNLTSNINANYENRYPKVYGRKLGALTYNDPSNPDLLNTPANLVPANITATRLDVATTPTRYTANISDTTSEKITGTGLNLRAANPQASCKRIKQTGGGGDNGTYTISPTGTDFQVYCDMETNGGGWTMVGRSAVGSTGNIGWGVSAGSVSNDSSHYSLGAITQSMNFEQIMVGRYTTAKNIDYAIQFNVNSNNLNLTSSATFPTLNCELVVSSGLTSTEKSWNHCNMFRFWGGFNDIGRIWFRDNISIGAYGIESSVVHASSGAYTSVFGAFGGRQGMVFIK